MPLPRLTLLAALSFAAIGTLAAIAQDAPVVDPAIATMTADQKVAARQAAMKEDGGLLRGAKDATGDDAVKIATTLVKNFTNFPALFADGATNDKSGALPVVWTEFDKFSAIFAGDQKAALDMLAAAKSGDKAAWLAGFNTLAGSCGQCHQSYRAPA